MLKVHFIAIGGSAMHNLAIALHHKGYLVTGSDDEIFNPSKERLAKYGLLPEKIGWNTSKVDIELDAVIVGMHAREDNVELQKAQDLGLKIFSYPEFIYEQTKSKKRVVIGGSHGKTTITSMILHVLDYHELDADYLVGAQLTGFDCMVRLSDSASIAIIEGDEYLSSPIDRRPKFHLYQPDIALLSGIAWDHVNVFPTFSNYVEQFDTFIDKITLDGALIYFDGDKEVVSVAERARKEIRKYTYGTHDHFIEEGVTCLKTDVGDVRIAIFGDHNLQNLNGAKLVCRELGISEDQFYVAIATFKGASKRLELVKRTNSAVMYKDFAHSPSKLKATTNALKQQYPKRELIACMELHTFSSLNKEFLTQYNGAMRAADRALVYYDPKVLKHKKLSPLSKEEVMEAFATSNVEVYIESESIIDELRKLSWKNKNLLMMSSGNFNGVNFGKLADELM
ncbi:Mur ligase family protein [Flavobacteriales bacterium]|nr:Mur ligase family protein [Flavobacteriales bacterium]